MKEKIHPGYEASTLVCVCGNIVKTRSTKPEIKIDVCSGCHPFFTGKQKILDSAGMVEKFRKRYGNREVKSNQ